MCIRFKVSFFISWCWARLIRNFHFTFHFLINKPKNSGEMNVFLKADYSSEVNSLALPRTKSNFAPRNTRGYFFSLVSSIGGGNFSVFFFVIFEFRYSFITNIVMTSSCKKTKFFYTLYSVCVFHWINFSFALRVDNGVEVKTMFLCVEPIQLFQNRTTNQCSITSGVISFCIFTVLARHAKQNIGQHTSAMNFGRETCAWDLVAHQFYHSLQYIKLPFWSKTMSIFFQILSKLFNI